MNKPLRLQIILLLICSSFATSAMAQNKKILVLGDSISASFGIDPAEGWVSLLATKLADSGKNDYRVINASISGSTSGDGLQRLPTLLRQYKPTIMIIELGGNDGLRGYPVKLMRENLQKIIDLSAASGAKVLLAGIEIPPNYGQRYTDAFRKNFFVLAEQNPVSFLPFILKDIATNQTMMQRDQIHPTAEAQAIILKNVWPHLESLL
ncbi:MAG: acyl-CoA thioesterase-1 [Cellvibrionaceae bacterium]|jgi:acyl-CoA thioesterase-1